MGNKNMMHVQTSNPWIALIALLLAGIAAYYGLDPAVDIADKGVAGEQVDLPEGVTPVDMGEEATAGRM